MNVEVIFYLKKQRELEKNFKKKKLYIIFFLKKDGLTDKQKKVLKNIGRYLKKSNNDLKKLNKYDNVMYGLDYLVNEVSEEDYYEPKEIKSAFDGSYVI